MSNIGNPVSHLERSVAGASEHRVATPAGSLAPEPGLAALARGVLVIRWAVLAWMAVLVGSGTTGLPQAALGWLIVGATAGWTLCLTVVRGRPPTGLLVADLGVAVSLVVLGTRYPGLATVYPVTTALTWGTARGVPGGIAAGCALAAASIGARLTGGSPGAGAGPTSLVALGRDPVYFLLAGGGIGFVATLLERSASQVRAAQAAQMRETERAARLTERELLGRQIHDSVLQALALVHKRGRELAHQEWVPAAEVARLTELAAAQERTLRGLILQAPEVPQVANAVGTRHESPGASAASLRRALEAAAEAVRGALDVTVSATDDLTLPSAYVREIAAAVDQALANVLAHAQTRHAWILAEVVDGDVTVTIRDDGQGFTFDEARLRAAGKFGLLRSIRGRVEQLGGTLHVDTAPGRGTELEMRVPRPAAEEARP